MNKLLVSILGLFAFLFSSTILVAQPRGSVVDGVAAVVGKYMVKESEIAVAKMQSRNANQGTPISECEIVETMLLNKLLLHRSNMDSITVSDDHVNREMDGRIQNMLTYYGTESNLERQFGKSIQEIRNQFFDIIKENMLVTMEQQKITTSVKTTPQEVSEYYHSIPADSIPNIDASVEVIQLVRKPSVLQADKESTRQRLEGYRDRILKGDKMSTLATLYSEDPGSSKKGGELGFFSRGQMLETFENAAFALKDPKEVSPVIETPYGYHIIQLIEQKGKQINCRHILLQPKASEQTILLEEKLLDSIANRIRQNQISIEDAVKEYSQDSSKTNGGYLLNTLDNSSIVPLKMLQEMMKGSRMKTDIDNLREGDITDVIPFQDEGGQGFRILFIKRKTPAHKMNLNQDYDKIYNVVLNNAQTKMVNEWAKKHIPNTYIYINEKYKSCLFELPWQK